MEDAAVPDYYVEGVQYHRANLSPHERALTLHHTIDPGFVNKRLVLTVLGEVGTEIINNLISQLPAMPDWQRDVQIGHIFKNVVLMFCEINGIRTLGEVVHNRKGRLFCSTEPWAPCPQIYEDGADRLVSRWTPYGDISTKVELHYSGKHVTSDTLRSELSSGAELSVVAHLQRRAGDTLVFHPLVIGNPWLYSPEEQWADKIMFWGRNFYEHFIEDFDEFSRVKEVPVPSDSLPMKDVSERAFKRALGQILGGAVGNDWGGETSDFSTSHLHLNGRRVTAAFLLKGPAKFSPMTMNHLGKNNDQIYRLAAEPADVLFVQHTHEVTPAVRATLRAFAVQPSRPRRYCVVDGRDSLRLLQAYGLYEQALSWSRQVGRR